MTEESSPRPFAKLGKQNPWVRPFIPVRRLDRIYANAMADPEGNVFDRILREMAVGA